MGKEKRVTVCIRESHHKKLVDAVKRTGYQQQALMDRAMDDLLENIVPVLLRTAEELDRPRRK